MAALAQKKKKMMMAMAMVMMMMMSILIGSEKAEGKSSAAAAAAAAIAPAPAPARPPDWHNITQVLVSAGYLTEFVKLVARETKVAEQWQSYVNASNTTGATIFAPLDEAFENAQVQALLTNISPQNLTDLLLYHSLPDFHSYKQLQLSSLQLNPTFASPSSSSAFLLNISNDDGQVTLHSSLTSANISSNYYNDFPLSIFAIDHILVPSEIFGEDVQIYPPSPSPSPSPSPPAVATTAATKSDKSAAAPPLLSCSLALLLLLLHQLLLSAAL